MVSGEVFELIYNKQFNALATNPKPGQNKMPAYYQSDSYLSHSNKGKGVFSKLYSQVRQYNLNLKRRWVEQKRKPAGRLLDLGTGVGLFLDTMKHSGWEVQGLEVSGQARKLAQSKNHMVHSEWDQLGQNPFDVVSMWHVLEHLEDLERYVRQIGALVNKRGYLFVAVPNHRSYDARYYKNFWAGYDVPRHLWHFSQESMNVLFQDEFDLVQKKPMWFDAFSVSLLSHYYKTGSKRSLIPFFVALWSNLKALVDGECSSITYIYQKRV